MPEPTSGGSISCGKECVICCCEIFQEFSRPECCYHEFHNKCITTWSKIRLTCPMCREKYNYIFTYSLEDPKNPKLYKTENFENPDIKALEEVEMLIGMNPYESTVCQICGGGENEEQILLCDECDEGFHMYCLSPLLTSIPQGSWFCTACEPRRSRLGNFERFTDIYRTAARTRVAIAVQSQLNLLSTGDESSEDDYSSNLDDLNNRDNDFAYLDDEVLANEPGPSNAPLRIVRRKRSKARKPTGSTPKRSKKRVNQRRQARKAARKRVQKQTEQKQERNGEHALAILRKGLSINGVGVDLPIFGDENITPPTPYEPPVNQPSSSCDLLSTIISNQEKTLASGKLFVQQGGRFKETKDFQKYREKFHKKLGNEHRRRLGMPVEEEKQPWEKPSSFSAKESGSTLQLDDSEIDAEVQCMLNEHEFDEKMRQQELLEIQQKAMADQKRERREKKLADERAKEVAEREKKRRLIEEEENLRREEKIKHDREKRERKDREKKEKEEKKNREQKKKREEERHDVDMREATVAKQEEKRREGKHHRSESRDKGRRSHKDDRRRDHSRDRSKDNKQNSHYNHLKTKEERKVEKYREHEHKHKPSVPNAFLGPSTSSAVFGQSPPPPPPDYGSLYPGLYQPGSFGIPPVRPPLGSSIPSSSTIPTSTGDPYQDIHIRTQLLFAQQQHIINSYKNPFELSGIPPLGTNISAMPLVSGTPIDIRPFIAKHEREEKRKKEEKEKKQKHKDSATKIIESYSISLAREYYNEKKITRQQYSDVMKKLMADYRSSYSIDELKSKDLRREIRQKMKDLLEKAVEKNREESVVIE